MSKLRCIIFDVDGTLVDSQADILACMEAGFAVVGREAPHREAVLSIVGLSLDSAIARLCPEASGDDLVQMVEGYKAAYVARRKAAGAGHAHFYPGMRELLDELAQVPENLLCIATGKSRRGLDALLESAGMERFFLSTQVADDHPSKPHPSMVAKVLRDTGTEAAQAVIIGDTSYDIEMGRAAGVGTIGVNWGYHPVTELEAAGAGEIVTSPAALPAAIQRATGG